jgi:hypothetical protein
MRDDAARKRIMFKRDFAMKQGIHKGILLLLLPAAIAGAQDLSGSEMRSLDGQVQEIKSDVLNIAAELNNLEERLLFPSNTQVSLFVSLAPRQDFRLDAVQVTINGELATHHIYSFNELEALQKGGVQRLYTGNVPTGDHQISVTVAGKLKNGKDFSESGSFSFSKGVKPKALGITLAGPGFGSQPISVGDW